MIVYSRADHTRVHTHTHSDTDTHTHPFTTVHFEWNVGTLVYCGGACVCVCAATAKIWISEDSLAVSASIYKLVVIQVAAKRGTRGNLCVNEEEEKNTYIPKI